MPRVSGNGAQKEQRAQEGLPRPLLPHGVSSSDFERESSHLNASPLSSERMSGALQQGASHGLCDETRSDLTLILLPTQYVTLASLTADAQLSLSFPLC